MAKPRTDYDSPWKEVLERYFEPFMALFFLHAHAEIDWSRGYEFFDKELPAKLEESFQVELTRHEETRKMRYVTSIERRAIQQGIEQGALQTLQANVIEVLTLRFRTIPQELIDQIQQSANPDWLKSCSGTL